MKYKETIPADKKILALDLEINFAAQMDRRNKINEKVIIGFIREGGKKGSPWVHAPQVHLISKSGFAVK